MKKFKKILPVFLVGALLFGNISHANAATTHTHMWIEAGTSEAIGSATHIYSKYVLVGTLEIRQNFTCYYDYVKTYQVETCWCGAERNTLIDTYEYSHDCGL